ncbi:hypothetical protein N2152v2_006226 [Parachlorella kessleri]
MSKRLPKNQTSEVTVDEGLPRQDFTALHSELLGYAGYARRGLPSVPARELSEEAVRRSALSEPLLVAAAPAAVSELGLVLPPEPLTPERIASQLGPSYEVRTYDAASQVEGPHWTLHQWGLYWEARRPLNKDAFIMPPPRLAPRLPPVEDEADSAAVTRRRTADSDITGQALKGITYECKKRLLEVQQLSVAGTPLEAFIQPPTAVRAADLLSHVFLAPHCEGVVRVDLKAGDTLVIPPGWIHAAASTGPSVMVAGNFLLRDSLAVHLEAWRLEEHLGLHPRARYPLFKQLMWYTAAHYAHSLQTIAGLSKQALEEGVAAKLQTWAEAAAGEATPVAGLKSAGLAGDSDSVLGTSKAGTTTQKRAGGPAPTSTMRNDACNQPVAQPQPGVSAGNRSIVFQRKPQGNRMPAVNSQPALGQAVAATPSVAGLVLAKGELKLTGAKRRRVARDDDSFIASDESGRGAAAEEQDWEPNHGGSSSTEGLHGDAELEGDDDVLSGSAAGAVAMKAREVSPLLAGSLGQRRPLQRLRKAGQGPSPGPSLREPQHQLGQQEEGQRGTVKKATRFRGNVPPRLAAMLQSLSPGNSPPHGTGGSAANHHTHPHSQQQYQQELQQNAYADTATTASALKPIRLKVKLRPEAQPATSGGLASGSAGARTPGSVPAIQRQASPRKLVLKITKAGGAPRSPGSATPGTVAKVQQCQNQAAAVNGHCHAHSPAAQGGGHGMSPTRPSGAAGPALPLQPQQPRLQLASLQQAAIPQVDGAMDDDGDVDSTVAVCAATLSESDQQLVQQQQQQEDDWHEEVMHIAPLGVGQEQRPGGLGQAGVPVGLEPLMPGTATVPSPVSPGHSQQSGARAPRQRQGLLATAEPGGDAEMLDAAPREQGEQAPHREALSQGPAATAPRDTAVLDEFARMYAELEQQHAQGPADEAQPVQPAESGGSVGYDGPSYGAGLASRRPQAPQQQQRLARSAGAVAAPLPSPQQQQQQQQAHQHHSHHQQQQQQQRRQQPVLGGGQQAGVSAVEAEGVAALLSVLKKWVAAHNALNDVPLSIKDPKEVLAALEVGMQALGLPLAPPPPVDLDSVPLERFRPRRPVGPAGTCPTLGVSRRPLSMQTASDLEAALEAGEEAADSVGGDLNVVVEESSGPGVRLEVAGAKQPARAQLAGRGGKKLTVKKSLMKKLHIK